MNESIDFNRSIRLVPVPASRDTDHAPDAAALRTASVSENLMRRVGDALSRPALTPRPSFGLPADWWNEGANAYPHCPSYLRDQLRLAGIARDGLDFIEARRDIDARAKTEVIAAIGGSGANTPGVSEAASSNPDLRLKESALHHVFAGTRKDFFTRHASWLAVGSAALAAGFWTANWRGIDAVDTWAARNRKGTSARVALELAPNVGLVVAGTFCGALVYGIVTGVCSRLNPGALHGSASGAASETASAAPSRGGFARRANLRDVALESLASAGLTGAFSVPKFLVDGYLTDPRLGSAPRHALAALGLPLDAMMVMASAYIGMKECHTALNQLVSAHVNDPSIPDAPPETVRHDTAFVLKQMPIRSAQLGTISTLAVLTGMTALAKMVTEMALASRPAARGADAMDQPMQTAMTVYNLVFVTLLVLDAIGLPIHNWLHDRRHERDLEGALRDLALGERDPEAPVAIDRRTSFFGPAGGLRIITAPPVRWVLGLTDRARPVPLGQDAPGLDPEAGPPVLPPIRCLSPFDPMRGRDSWA